MPYESEIDELRELANDPEYYEPLGLQGWQVRYITEKAIKDLPLLPNDSSFLNFNIFEFVIPESDKEFLISRAIKANNLISL